jgi:glutathione S-transferase
MIKLHGIPMSRAFRPLWLLHELGVEHENVPVNFTGDNRKPDFLKLNPNGHIPVLQDGDFVLWESMAINLYLARRYDRGLWPKTVEDEGRTFQWSFWVMTEVETPLLAVLMNRVLLPEAQRDTKAADAAAEKLRGPLAVLDDALAGRDYLLGADFSVADLNVASVLTWARPARIDLSTTPNAAAWLQRCLSRPAVAKARGQ